MKIYFKKKKKGQTEGFTFPAMEAALDEKFIDELKMRPAFTRLAKRLKKQIKADGITIIGVRFNTIHFKNDD